MEAHQHLPGRARVEKGYSPTEIPVQRTLARGSERDPVWTSVVRGPRAVVVHPVANLRLTEVTLTFGVDVLTGIGAAGIGAAGIGAAGIGAGAIGAAGIGAAAIGIAGIAAAAIGIAGIGAAAIGIAGIGAAAIGIAGIGAGSAW